MRFRDPRWAVVRSVLFFLIVLAVFFVRAFVVRRFTTDDAGITYAYALHLAKGQGFRAVIGGPLVEGYSNFLWLMVLFAAFKLGAAIPLAAQLLGALLGAGGIVIAIVILRQLEDRRGALTLADLALGLLIACSSEYTIWSIGGLENALYACLLLGLIARTLRESDRGGFPDSALLGLGVCLTRPEGVMYVGALYAMRTVLALRKRVPLRQLALSIGLFGLLFATYQIWHYATFLDLRPNTFYAKRPQLDFGHLRDGGKYLYDNASAGMLSFGLPFVLYALRDLRAKRLFLLIVLVAGIFFMLYAGGDWMGHFRLGSHLIPMYAVLAVIGVQECATLPIFRRNVTNPGFAKRIPFLLLCATEVVLVALFVHRQQKNSKTRVDIDVRSKSHFQRVLDGADAMYERAQKLELFPATIAVHDFGGFAWRSSPQFQPIDYLALCDVSLAHIVFDYGPHRPQIARRAMWQSMFRERGPNPSMLYIPTGHFFANLEGSVDQVNSYFHTMSKNGFNLLIHRGSLLHYHPPFETFLSLPIRDGRFERMRVLGFALRGTAAPGEKVMLQLALLPQIGINAVSEISVKIALRDGAQSVETKAKRLFDGDWVLLHQWQAGEPIYLELPLTLPAVAGPEYSFALDVHFDAGKWLSLDLPPIPKGARFAETADSLPRFPSALPGPISPALATMEQSLQQLQLRRQQASDLTLIDHDLATSLIHEGMEHDKKGELEDSYLSYVFAMQADPASTVALDRRVAALRERLPNRDAEFLRQIELTRHFYNAPSPTTAERLILHLRAGHHEALARYFAKRANLPAASP